MSGRKSNLLVCVVVSLFVSALSWGATVIVDPNGNGDFTTIQAAIDNPNTQTGDVVVVSEGTYVENLVIEDKSITLRSSDPEDTYIMEHTIIDGDANGSVIRIKGDSSMNTVIRGFTIQNGNACKSSSPLADDLENKGGGICVEPSDNNQTPDVSVYNCIVKNNHACYAGGGIFNVDGIIKNCIIEGNSAWYIDGDPEVAGTESGPGQGGGLACCHNESNNPLLGGIKDCIIQNNTAFAGGGLYVCGQIIRCQILENTTLSYGRGDTWLGNIAKGSGAYSCSGLYGCLIKGNEVFVGSEGNYEGAGGGLCDCDFIENCEIVGNRTQWIGGGLSGCGSVKDCVIACNEATSTQENHEGTGGGASCSSLEDCVISNNAAYRGGGIYSGTVYTSFISGNGAASSGGGVYFNGSEGGRVESCVISGNTATSGSAAAGQSIRLMNCTAVGNKGNSVVYDENSNSDTGNSIILNNLPSIPIDNTPKFLDPGEWDDNGTSGDTTDDIWIDGNYHLASDSPCIDAGENNLVNGDYDLDGNDRIVDFPRVDPDEAIVDLGAYEAVDGPVVTSIDENNSTSNRTGTLYGNSGYVEGGHTRTALQLDGDGAYLEIDDYTGVDDVYPRICSAWIKTSAPGGQIYTIASWGKAETGKKFMLFLDEYGGSNSRLAVGIWGYRLTGTQKLNDDNWHHVAASYDSYVNLLCLYVDGKLEASSTVSLNTSNLENVLIGAYRNNLNTITGYFNGLLDDVRIHKFNTSESDSLYPKDRDEIEMLAGPRCHWELNESTGMLAHDSTDNTYHGKLKNFEDEECSPAITGSKWKEGVLGHALRFDGDDDYVELPSNMIDPADTAFSAFVWVNLEQKQGSDAQIILQQCDAGTDSGRAWLWRSSDDKLCSSIGGSSTVSTTAVFANTGEWHHVGVTYDGSTVTLYVDGQACGFASRNAESCTGKFYLGRFKLNGYAETYANWDGEIDDVRIYDRVLRADEIQVLADASVAHWEFDENNGSIAFDSSLSFNHTTVNGAQWVNGKLGTALAFGGTGDYVQADNYAGITGDRSRTCAAWIKTTGTDGVILSWGLAETGKKWIFRVGSTGQLEVGVWNGFIRGTSLVNDGQWHHIAAVLENDGYPTLDEIRLYVDGVEQTTSCYNYVGDLPHICTDNTQLVLVGARYDNLAYADFFYGVIDDVRIYERALTQTEIQALPGVGQ